MLGSKSVNGETIKMNGAVYVFCGILNFVVASADEAEIGTILQHEGRPGSTHSSA